MCLLSLLPHLHPGSGRPQTLECDVTLWASFPRRYVLYKGSHRKGACGSLLNGVINAQVVTVAQSTGHSDISSVALQTSGSSLYTFLLVCSGTTGSSGSSMGV